MSFQSGEPAAPVPVEAVELVPPDISPYRTGNMDIPFAHRMESGRPGPHVLICALMHGNEICGAIALDHLLREDVRPERGTLSLVFANVAAYQAFDPANPAASRFVDEDMNRLWGAKPSSGATPSAERARVEAIRPIVEDADCVLDLHSMQSGERPLLLAGPTRKGRNFARAMESPGVVISDIGHPNGMRMRDSGSFNDPASPRNAVLVECGPHWRRTTAIAAIDTTYRFLQQTGLVSRERAAPHLVAGAGPERWVEVTDRFVPETAAATFVGNFHGLEVIPEAGTVIAFDGSRQVRTPYDNCVLIMPARRPARGQTAVRLGRWRDFEDPHDG